MGDLIEFETEQHVRSPGYRTVQAKAAALTTIRQLQLDEAPDADIIAALQAALQLYLAPH